MLVCNNVLVSYDCDRSICLSDRDKHLPSEAEVTVVDCGHIQVKPFEGECHSTNDYNGIALLLPTSITFIPTSQISAYLSSHSSH